MSRIPPDLSMPAAGPTLKFLNYGSPILTFCYWFTATIVAQCDTRPKHRKTLSSTRKLWLICLSFGTTLCYLAQALATIPQLSSVPDDSLIHVLSEFLLWTFLSLLILNRNSPLPPGWKTLSTLNLVFEIAIVVLTFDRHPPSSSDSIFAYEGLQVSTLVVLALFTSFAFFCSLHVGYDDTQDDMQPILAKDANNSSPRTTPVGTYHTISTEESESHGGDSGSYSGSGSDGNDDSDSDDDEDDMKALQKERLQNAGGWISYLKTFKVFLPYLWPRDNLRLQAYLVWMFVNVLITRVLNVLHPRQLGIIVDTLVNERIMPWKAIFLWMLFQTLASESIGLVAVNELLQYRLQAWSSRTLTAASLDHVMGLSMAFHDQKDSGEIIKAIEQAGSIGSILELFILDVLPCGLDIFIAMFYVTILLDVYALLVLIAVAIAFIFATYYITLLSSAARRIAARKEREESKAVYESISNWFSIMCLNRKKYTVARLAHLVEGAATARRWSEDLYTAMFAAQETAEAFGRLAIVIIAAHRIVIGIATVGTLITLNSYWETIMLPLYVLGRSYRRINTYFIDAERLLQLFQEVPTVRDSPNALTLEKVEGKVLFDSVDFTYPGRDAAFKNLNLNADVGQMIALVGETGSGKSTILKILMRFYDVTSGRITIDGHDLRDLTLDSLRNCFGFVPQDTVLFNISILENVRYGNIHATDDEVFAACRAASIHDKILSFPRGYASKVGERGVKLSGGERQRIAIARVFLKDPQIVLLDEATSALDSQTETKIQTALRKLTKGRTTFVIAHRLSTIVHADKILVIDQGEVAESGSHEELLRLKGKYLDLWSKQAAVLAPE